MLQISLCPTDEIYAAMPKQGKQMSHPNMHMTSNAQQSPQANVRQTARPT